MRPAAALLLHHLFWMLCATSGGIIAPSQHSALQLLSPKTRTATKAKFKLTPAHVLLTSMQAALERATSLSRCWTGASWGRLAAWRPCTP